MEEDEVEVELDGMRGEEMKRNKLIYLELQEYSPYPNILDKSAHQKYIAEDLPKDNKKLLKKKKETPLEDAFSELRKNV